MNVGGLDLGSLSPEEREYLLKNLPNLTGMEEEAGHQQALANALRVEPTRRMDWGSQASRAISGIGSGLAAQQAQKTRAATGEAYGKFGGGWADLLRKLREQRMAGSTGAMAGMEDVWGRS